MYLLVTALCLLQWSLVEVHSQTVPYASFLEKTLPNHTYVNLSLVGNCESTATIQNSGIECHTDLTTCCRAADGVHRGDWYFPNGTRLKFRGDRTNIFEARQNQSVDLRRRIIHGAVLISGIYRCDISTFTTKDNNNMTKSIYVGLYYKEGDIGNVRLTMNSDLNGESPQFTLTCISTGGPVTTVTWTRDSVIVTEDTSTILDDPVTAQYTHTLTGRLGGLYTCTVANDKPSSGSAELRVDGLTSEEEQIIISLTPSVSSIMAGGTITLTCTVTGESSAPEFMWVRPDGVSTTDASTTSGQNVSSVLTLGDIVPSQAGQYICTATLANGVSKSTSITVTVQISVTTPSISVTTNSTAGTTLSLTCDYTLTPSVDAAVETAVSWMVNGSAVETSQDGRISTDGATLIFSPLTTSDTGRYTCTLTITAPYVSLQGPVESEENTITVQIPQPGVVITLSHTAPLYAGTSLTLTCTVTLDPNVDSSESVVTEWNGPREVAEDRHSAIPAMRGSGNSYTGSLTVSPLTDQDGGTYTCTATISGGTHVKPATATDDINIVVTNVDLVKVSVANKTHQTISFSWTSIPGIVVTGYNISYSTKDETCLIDSNTVSVDSNTENYTLTGLQEYTKYVITVHILNESSIIYAGIIEATTLPAAPSAAPTSVTISEVTSSSITVQWSPVDCIHHNGDILGYSVRYGVVGSESTQILSVSGSTVTEATILNLMSSTNYEVNVAAVNAVGTGNFSNKMSALTLVEENGSSGGVTGPVAGVIIGVVILVVITVIVIILIRRRSKRGSMKVKSKPLTPLRKLEEREHRNNGEEAEEELEMTGLSATAEEDKNDYYFEDPSNIVTGRNDIPEADFPDHVKQMHQNRDHKLENEYRSLDNMPKPPCEVARLSCNIPQNRFKNIYPYNHNRVRLCGDPNVEGSDYINASFIDGYHKQKHAYIASQGPVVQTVGKFWQMVWEHQLPTIVMLTRCVEDSKEKCEKYWPDQLKTTVTKGSQFNVTLTSYIPAAEYEISKLTLTSTTDPECELSVTHMHYTAWPDHGVPRNAMSVISFIHRVRKEHPAYLDKPLLVHCSAGVGRTGTFILLDCAMQQMKREGTLSVFKHLKTLRTQRMKMVQTQAQYVFIHNALSELVVCGETDVAAANVRVLSNEMKEQLEGEQIGTTGFQKQFQILERVSSQYQASYQEAKAEYNVDKNRFPDKLPNELGRVRLKYSSKQGSDYINASFIDGYKQCRAYIATQYPLPGTVNDFWRMVWEYNCSCIVLLCDIMENDKESSHCFWPEQSGSAGVEAPEEVYGKISVALKKLSSHGDIIERRLEMGEVTGKATSIKKAVTLIQLTSWSLQELPHPSSILSLVDLLNKAQRSSPSKHTIIMCSDGVGRTGTFICLHSKLERLKTEGVVDFFQAVKSARIQRAGLVPDAAHYAFCHDVVANYVDSFETYANFKEVV